MSDRHHASLVPTRPSAQLDAALGLGLAHALLDHVLQPVQLHHQPPQALLLYLLPLVGSDLGLDVALPVPLSPLQCLLQQFFFFLESLVLAFLGLEHFPHVRQFLLHQFLFLDHSVLLFPFTYLQLFQLLLQLTVDVVQVQLLLLLKGNFPLQLAHSLLLQSQLLPYQCLNRLHLLDQLPSLRPTEPLPFLLPLLLVWPIQLSYLQRGLFLLGLAEHFECIFGGFCLDSGFLTEQQSLFGGLALLQLGGEFVFQSLDDVLGALVLLVDVGHRAAYLTHNRLPNQTLSWLVTSQILSVMEVQATDMREALLSHYNTQPTPRRSMLPSRNTNKENRPNNRSPLVPARRSLCPKADSSQEMPKNRPSHRSSRPQAQQQPMHRCENHEDLESSYHITTEERELYYCQKCATRLKNQGFPVRKIEEEQSLLSNHMRYSGNPQFEVLRGMLGDIYNMQGVFKEAEMPHSEYEELFSWKMEKQERLYDTAEQLVLRAREESRSALMRMKEEWMGKITSSQSRYESESAPLEDLEIMRTDIEGNIESIINQVDEETFQQCVSNYRERLDAFGEEARERLAAVSTLKATLNTLTDNDVDSLIAALSQLKNELSPAHSTTIKGSSTQVVLTSEAEEVGEVKGAFRNLFQPGRQRNHRSRSRLISRR